MKKTILAVCCATLMGLGTAAAQTSGAPAQDTMGQNDTTMSKGSSMSKGYTSKGKMAKRKMAKHKTVGMSKNSKMKSNTMKKDNMSK